MRRQPSSTGNPGLFETRSRRLSKLALRSFVTTSAPLPAKETSGTDIDQMVFELHSFLQEVSLMHLLLDDPMGRVRGQRAIEHLLERHGARPLS